MVDSFASLPESIVADGMFQPAGISLLAAAPPSGTMTLSAFSTARIRWAMLRMVFPFIDGCCRQGSCFPPVRSKDRVPQIRCRQTDRWTVPCQVLQKHAGDRQPLPVQTFWKFQNVFFTRIPFLTKAAKDGVFPVRCRNLFYSDRFSVQNSSMQFSIIA